MLWGTEHFNLSETMTLIGHALVAIVCRVGLEVAVHGFYVACMVGLVGFFLRGHKAAKPLRVVFKKLALFCFVLALPGIVALVTQGKLPAVNNLQLSPFGLIGFWCLVVLHLCMEEMNFQWFTET